MTFIILLVTIWSLIFLHNLSNSFFSICRRRIIVLRMLWLTIGKTVVSVHNLVLIIILIVLIKFITTYITSPLIFIF